MEVIGSCSETEGREGSDAKSMELGFWGRRRRVIHCDALFFVIDFNLS